MNANIQTPTNKTNTNGTDTTAYASAGGRTVPPLRKPWYGIGFKDASRRFWKKALVMRGRASRGILVGDAAVSSHRSRRHAGDASRGCDHLA